ncbi:peptidyl-prolyl cis-trans isomerase [Bacillus glycinifermentans]|uniref:peptidyl-prolyl cis-trans isomerase n=1 Tax=Bacillus glycinifermentans TaxID=1664069 RepID=UPI001FF4E093|nr:peptidyl-prolyl cis-trans isomerase [Bacillus glycinifermentans]UOY88884.1 peptidyl-prolyl cis-trans isomerase [Bacillus glycinifermentans]
MEIITITGNVKYAITLDPSVWIFDDRKFELDRFFSKEAEQEQDYLDIDRERIIREGAVSPPTLKSEKKYEREKLLDGTFAIKLEPFLHNAEVSETAAFCIFKTEAGDFSVPIGEAGGILLCFSKNGKPLTEDGPVHVYFADGSNRTNPIKNVKEIHVQ